MNGRKIPFEALKIAVAEGELDEPYRAPTLLSAGERWTLRRLRANRFISVTDAMPVILVKAGYVVKGPESWFLTAAGKKAIDREAKP